MRRYLNKQLKPHLLAYAEKLREAAKFKGLTATQIAEHLNVNSTAVQHWLVGINGASAAYRPAAAKLLGLSINDLVAPPNPNPQTPGKKSELKSEHTGPAQRALVAYQDKAASIPYTPPVSDLCSFKLRSDGTVSVRLDTTLPYAKGLRLMGYLFEIGLVPEQDKGAPS